MLDVADIPVGIPQPDSQLKVRVKTDRGLVADTHGSAGWAQSVGNVLDGLGIPG